MKFFKKDTASKQRKEEKFPGSCSGKSKKISKMCRTCPHPNGIEAVLRCQAFSDQCLVCEGTFFPSLLKEMSSILDCFNKCVKKLLHLHLASGFQKFFSTHSDHAALIEEGKRLVTYALDNVVAIKKILEKYDKNYCSNHEQTFKCQAQRMQTEILRNPWFYELIAFHISSNKSKFNSEEASASPERIDFTFNDGKPSLICELSDSAKLDIDLTCSICLETLFDPVCLTCGHIFCYMCACSVASVSIVDGLRAAEHKKKCPLCREEGVFAGAVHLDELSVLLSQRCQEYWEQRLQRERIERIQQAKQYWKRQCRAFLGV